jgi:hypothetical protein
MHHLYLQNLVELAKFVHRLGKTSPLGDIVGAAPTPTTHPCVADECLTRLVFGSAGA